MKQTITYQQLENLANDISRQMESSPAFKLFHKEKINRFFDKNNQRLQVAMEKRRELIRMYVKKDEKGKPLTEERDGQEVYVFDTPEKEKEYLDEFNEFMNRTFDLNF